MYTRKISISFPDLIPWYTIFCQRVYSTVVIIDSIETRGNIFNALLQLCKISKTLWNSGEEAKFCNATPMRREIPTREETIFLMNLIITSLWKKKIKSIWKAVGRVKSLKIYVNLFLITIFNLFACITKSMERKYWFFEKLYYQSSK